MSDKKLEPGRGLFLLFVVVVAGGFVLTIAAGIGTVH